MKFIKTTPTAFLLIGLIYYAVTINVYAQEIEYLDLNIHSIDSVLSETQQNIKKPLCSLSYNSTNLKIIDIILPATGSFNPLCMLTVNDLLNTNYTIKGTFQDRYILLEKLK
jgi:hypothetical protein